jgi:uncharacterized protein (UPF0264 family)
VALCVQTARPVSIALGELRELPAALDVFAPYHAALALPQVQFAKIGLAGSAELDRWWLDWEQAWRRLPAHLGRVGVVYADWQAAHMPHPGEALQVFADGACRGILFDTFTKNGGPLVDMVPGELLAKWLEIARKSAPLIVLAGSLTADSLSALRALQPELVGVRGAVCSGGRCGRISARRLRHFISTLQQTFDFQPLTTC